MDIGNTDSKVTSKVDSIIHAQWIITVDENHRNGQPTPLEQHAVVINQGKIVDITPTNDCPYQSDNVIHRPHHILMPGMINAHTHAAMSLFRGLADDMPLMTWLNDHIWPAEGQWVNEDFVRDGTQLAIAEMIRGGTTCFCDMYFYPSVGAQTAKDAQMRASFAFPILDFPSSWAQNADEYLSKGLALYDTYRNHELIDIHFGPHAPYTVSDEPLTKVATLSVETGMGVQIHLHETAHEISESLAQHGQRPIARLEQLKLLTPQLQAAHMTQLNDDEIQLLAKHGVNVIHCPESNLKLASGFCPIAKLSAAGVNVALGTDGAASNNDLDMFSEMRTAALLAKGVSGDPSAIPASEAIAMATFNGARALGIDDLTGSLEKGKAADLIAIDMSAPETQPYYDPISQLVYATTADKVSDSWINGKQVLRHRELTTLDRDDIVARAKAWKTKISGLAPAASHK
ncbi:N-ethylammeline chlorohydrolase [Gammaproteobacteria bacterium 45_16_T64]|nr:N-ethylammeline chlorohydrolase [Gammaproteobacteria bacterium 45_16_T64]